jgi:hypothetical protein
VTTRRKRAPRRRAAAPADRRTKQPDIPAVVSALRHDAVLALDAWPKEAAPRELRENEFGTSDTRPGWILETSATLLGAGGGRVAYADPRGKELLAAVMNAIVSLPEEQRETARLLFHGGPGAFFDALADVLESGAPAGNLLTAAGNALAHAFKREALRRALVASAWNLTRTAELLRMAGPSSVLRAVADLGLRDELDRARRAGFVTQAWNKKKPGD